MPKAVAVAGRPLASQADTLTHPIMLALFVFCLTQPYLLQLGPLIMAPYRLLLLCLLAPLAIGWLRGAYGPFMLTDFLLLGHLFWMGVSMLANGQARQIPEFVGSQTIDLFGAYLLGRAAIRTKRDMIFFVKCFLIVLIILVPFAVIESIGKVMILNDIAQKLPMAEAHPRSTLNYEARLGMQRAQTATPHPILYGIVSAMAFGLGWIGLRHTTPPTSVTGRGLWLSGSLGGTFLSLSAGAWLVVMLQIVLLSFNRVFRNIKPRWWLLLSGFVAFYIFVEFYSERPPPLVFARMIALDAQTAWFRYMTFEFGSAEVLRHPVLGMGLFEDYVRASWMIPSVDNHWLLNAMRWGFPGFFLLLGLAFAPIIGLARKNFSNNADLSDLRYALVFCLIAVYVSMSTVLIWNIIYAFMMLLIGASVWLQRIEPDTADTADTAPEAATSRHMAPKPGPKRDGGAPYSRFSGTTPGAPRTTTRFHRQPRSDRKEQPPKVK